MRWTAQLIWVLPVKKKKIDKIKKENKCINKISLNDYIYLHTK